MNGEDDAGGDSLPPASEKQLNFIRVLVRKVALDDEELQNLLEEVTGKEALEELSRREASEVIDELQTVAREKGIDLDSRPSASEKQVNFIRSLKRRAHLTEEELAALLEEVGGVTAPEELSRRDASAVIDELLARADEAKAGGARKKAAAPAAEPEEGDDEEEVPF
jgi:hypothetical protein